MSNVLSTLSPVCRHTGLDLAYDELRLDCVGTRHSCHTSSESLYTRDMPLHVRKFVFMPPPISQAVRPFVTNLVNMIF